MGEMLCGSCTASDEGAVDRVKLEDKSLANESIEPDCSSEEEFGISGGPGPEGGGCVLGVPTGVESFVGSVGPSELRET